MERLNERLVREWHESAGEKVRAERRFSLGAIQDFAEWVLARAALEAARELREENDNLKHDLERQMTIANIECNQAVELREEIERLTCANRNLRQQLEPYLKGEKTIRVARQQMRDELAAERAERSSLTNQGKAQG